MRKNTVVTMIIIMLLSLFALGMNQVSEPELQNAVSDGIWVADTIEGFNNAYLIVFNSDAGTHSYVVQDGVSFGKLLPEVPPRESCLGYWLIDGTTDSFLTSGTPLTRDLSVSAYYEYIDGAGDYMAGRSGILMRYSDKDKPADDHTGNNDKQLVSSEVDSNGSLKRVMASKVTADNEPPVWFFDYAGLYGSNENVSLYYVRSSLGYLKVEGNSLKISSDPVKLLVLLLEDDGVCISSENNAYSQDWANGKIKDFKNYFSDSQKFYLYNGTFGNELVTLSFDPDGGNIIPVSLTDYKGKTVRIPGYYGNRYGYEFKGWARERRASEPEFMPNDVYTYEKDETLFAVWERIAPVSVFIDPNGGTPAEGYAFNQYPGVEIDWSKYPVENGQHELLGWAFERDASDPEYGPGETYIVGDEDKTLYAVWDVLVDVKANGGNGDVLLRYAPDTEIDLSAINVSKGEHQLLGWAESAGGEIKYQPDAKLTAKADLTLYAVWDNGKIYVAFYNYDGSVLSRHSYAPDETPGTLPVPAVSSRGEDYEFLGWTTIEGDSEPQLTPEQTAIQAPDADTYYYQVWKHWVTVTFEAENAQTNPDKMRLAAGAGFLLSEIEIIQSAEDGRLFSYWTDGLNFYLQTGTLLVPDHDVTLKAVWKSPLYTIKFDKNGGNAAAPASEKLRYGEILEHLPEYSGTKTGYDFLGWAEGKDRNVDKDPNGTDTKHYLKIYRPGESYQMNYEKDIVLYAYWNPKTVNQKEGVKFGLRLDGVIPNEPSGFSIGEYSTQYYAGHVSDEIHNPGNVFKWGIQPTQEWVYDLDTDEGDLIGYYKDNAVVQALGYNVPSLDEVKRMSDNSFDPEKQFVIWYVLKYHGRSAKDYVVEGSPSCPEGSEIDAQGFCLNADGKRFNETGGDNRNGQKLWNVDGVIVNKKNIWVNYEPGLSGITVLNMPARYSMYIQKNRQGEPIAKNIKVGATFMKNEFKPYKPEAKDYIFLGWKVKGGDDTLYPQMENYSLTDNVTFVAQWRRPSAVNSSVSKIWSGDDGYGVRPDSITVSLWQQVGSASPSRTSVSVTLPTEDDKWSYTVSGLPQFSSETATTTGTPITYFWRENTVPDRYVETHDDTNNSTYITNTFTPNPSLNVVKTADPENGVEAGDTVTYTVVVTNNGNVTVSDIRMKDTLYEALSSEEAFTLQPAGSKEFTYTYTVTQADVDAGKIDNTVTAAGKDPRNDDVSDSDDATVTTVAANPAITVVKTADPTSGVEAGDTVTYTVVVTNNGNVTVSSIEMEDTLVKLNAAPFDLAPGESKNDITYTYKVTQADVDAGKIDNTATATGKDPKNDDVTASDDAEVTTVAAAPAITVVKTADPTSGVIVGDTVTYTVVVTNSGNVTVSNISMSDTLVELSVEPFDLAPGQSKEDIIYTYTVTQADVDAGQINNTATATGKDPKNDDVTASDDAEVTTVAAAPAITVVKTADPTSGVIVGDTVTYTVVVTNSGNVTVSNISMSDTLVELSVEPFDLAPGQSKDNITYTYTVTQADVDAGKIDNTAAAAGKDPRNNNVTASDDATVTTVAADPAITVAKTASPASGVEAGAAVTYTVVVTNSGNVTLTHVNLTDTLVTLDEESYTLAPGGSETVTYQYVVTQSDVDNQLITNTVTAEGTAPDNSTVEDDATANVTPVAADPELTVVKTADPTSGLEAGDTVSYRVVVTNTGNVTVHDIYFTDTLVEQNAAPFTLAPDGTRTFEYTYTVQQSDVDAGQIDNTAEAKGLDPQNNEVKDDDDAEVTTLRHPEISVTKTTAIHDGYKLGDTVNYKIVVKNTGNLTLSNITVTDDLTRTRWTDITLAPGESTTLTDTYIIKASDVADAGSANTPDDLAGKEVVNTASASGTDPFDVTVTDSDNEKINTVKIPLTIRAASDEKTYDGEALTNNGWEHIAGVLADENTISSVTVTGSRTDFGSSPNAASGAVILDGGKNNVTAAYAISYIDGKLNVLRRPVQVKADDKNKVYGAADPTFTAKETGLIGKDKITYTLSREPGEDVGTYIITPSGDEEQGNYVVTYLPGTLEITQRPLSIIADDGTKTYDGKALTVGTFKTGEGRDDDGNPIGGGLIPGDSVVESSITITGSIINVGTETNVLSKQASITNEDGKDVTGNYSINYVNGLLTVTPAAVVVKADDKTKVYGDKDPDLTAKVNGLISEDDEIAYTLSRAEGENVGPYTITPSGAEEQGNYIVSYETGTLTITPKPLTITAQNDTKVYDGTPLTKNSYTKTDLAEGDVLSDVSVTGSRTYVGKSANVPGGGEIKNKSGDVVTGNYTISYQNGELEVTKRSITITADSASKIYDGSPLTKNSYTTNTAPAPGDKIQSVSVTGSQTVVGTSPNVAKDAKIYRGETDVTENYNITYLPGELTVTQNLSLVIIADSAEKVYDGTALTKSSYTYTGLAKGDRIDSVTVTGSQTKTGTSDNVLSPAKIVNSDGVDVTASYAISYKNGKLEVKPKPLTITAASDVKTYDGTPLTKNSYTKTDLAAGDGITAITVSGSQTNVGESPNKAGDVTIRNGANEDVTDCYVITCVDGSLKVTPKTLTITAGSNHKEYDGRALTENSYTTDNGLVGTDQIESVTVTGTQTLVGRSANVPSAAQIVNNGEDVTNNYNIIYANGSLEVTKKPVTVTADSDAKVYDGKALTKNSASTTELAEGDSLNAVKVTGSQTNVGFSDNVPDEAKFINAGGTDVTFCYDINYDNGVLRVTPMAVTITAGSSSKVYDGKALTLNSYTHTDLAEGDRVKTVTITGSQTVVGDSANVPSYAQIVNASGQNVTRNYAVGYGNGILKVTPKDLTITADSGKKIYDGTPLTKDSYTNSDLAEGDSIGSVTVTGSQTFVGSSDNVPNEAKIRNNAGNDVTNCYNISYVNGNLEVTPKTLTITADSDEKVYDGKALTKNSYTNTALAENDSIESVVVTGSQTIVGSSYNTPSAAKIVNKAGEDVTASYTIRYDPGTLTVTPRKAVVAAASDEKVYDGTPLTNSGFTGRDLAEGDSVESAVVTGQRTTVGTADNVAGSAKIVNANGDDVTASYAVSYEKGILKVTPKKLVITADSDEKVYDGKTLRKDSYTSTGLASGDSFFSVTVTGMQTLVGKSDNVPDKAGIINAEREDVTSSYEIEYVNGTLEVTPKPITVTADNAVKVYDGTPLTKDSFTSTDPASGDRVVSAVVTGSQTEVGTSDNVPSEAKILSRGGNDVTFCYDIKYASGTLEVTPKVLTITADSDYKVYDGTALTKNSYTNSALGAGDTITSVTVSGAQINVGTNKNVPDKAKIVNSDGEDVTSSYAITYVNGELEVTPKPVTITAGSDTKVYDGTALTKDSYTNTGLAAGDSIDEVKVTGSQTVVGTSDNKPSDAVILNGAGENVTANYAVTYTNGTLEVTKKPLTIIADSDTRVYDGTALTKDSYENTALAAGDSISSVTVTGSQTVKGTSNNVPRNAVITNSDGENVTECYEVNYVNGTLEVTPKPVTVTADSASKIYDGTPLTKNSYTNSALAAGDSFSVVVVRGSQTNAGSSYNVASGARIVNAKGTDVTDSYDITYVKGLLEVTIYPSLVITAASDSKTYDGKPLTKDGYTSSVLMPGDTLVSVVVRGTITNVGNVPNVPSAAEILNANGEDVTGNYRITYVPGTLVVKSRTVRITAASAAKVYDGTELTKDGYSVSGLLDGERISSITVDGAQTEAGRHANEASGAVIVNADGKDVTANFNIEYIPGELVVTKRPLTITADNGKKVYDGSVLTADGYTASNVAPADAVGSVTVTGSRLTVGTSDNVPSDAVIVNRSGDDVTHNYTIKYIDGTLEVTPKPITITADGAEKVYDGRPLTKDTYTNTALAAGDEISRVTLTGSQTNVGSSPNVPSDAVIRNKAGDNVTENYSIRYVENTLSVTPKTIVITGGDAEKIYDGRELTSDDFSSSGLADGDSVDSVTVTGGQTDAGTGPNTPDEAVIKNADGEDVTSNYKIVYEDGTLTVTKKPIIITAGSDKKVYDGKPLTNDEYASSAEDGEGTGLADGDSIKSVKTDGSQTNVGKSSNVPSDAEIVDGDGRDVTGNYDITYVDGTLEVTPKVVTVTVHDQTKEYGQKDEDPEVTVEGNLNNDPITYEVTREEGEEPGTYPITPSGEEEQGNYIVVYVPGTLTITYNPSAATIEKVWVDDNNRDGIRPVSLAVTLTGSDGSVRTRRLNDANGWTVTIDDLPLYYNDEPIRYTWSEEMIEGYTLIETVNGNNAVFSNVHEVARTAVSVRKVWDDRNNAGGMRPDALSVRLQSNGSVILSATLNADNGWSATVNNLPLYENGSPVEYSWTEQTIGGYYPVSAVKSGSQTTFTNSNIYTLTIHYVYENGETAAGDYFAEQPAGVTFAVDSPVITGYTASQTVVTGTQPAGNIEITVVYKAEDPADIPVLIPTRTPTPGPEPTPVPTVVPHDEPEPQKDVPEPRHAEPDEEHPVVVAEPNILVDIDDLETALGLGEVFINNSGYALE